MIDPYKITNYNRTDDELAEFWLFCLAVAGKKATMIAKKVDDFLEPARRPNQIFKGYFSWLHYMANTGGCGSQLMHQLHSVKMGKYTLLERGYAESAAKGIDWFRTASAEDIRKDITGAGYKTSRFFTLHSRANEQVAVIDTHMLKYLNHIGASNVPAGIPNGPDYLRLEKVLLAEAAKKNLTMADFDLKIWSHYASNGATPLP
jgi:hypothetical protein